MQQFPGVQLKLALRWGGGCVLQMEIASLSLLATDCEPGVFPAEPENPFLQLVAF